MTESNTSAPAEAPEYRKRGRSKTPLIITIAVIAVAAIVAALVFWLGRDRDSTAGGGGNGAGKELVVGLQLEPSNLDIRATGGVALDQILIDNVYQGLIGLKDGWDDTFNSLLEAADTIKRGWTALQDETFRGMIKRGIYSDSFEQKAFAQAIGISESSLTKRLYAGNIKFYIRLRKTVESGVRRLWHEA